MKIPPELWEKYKVTDADAAMFLIHWDEPPGARVLVVGCRKVPVKRLAPDGR